MLFRSCIFNIFSNKRIAVITPVKTVCVHELNLFGNHVAILKRIVSSQPRASAWRLEKSGNRAIETRVPARYLGRR